MGRDMNGLRYDVVKCIVEIWCRDMNGLRYDVVKCMVEIWCRDMNGLRYGVVISTVLSCTHSLFQLAGRLAAVDGFGVCFRISRFSVSFVGCVWRRVIASGCVLMRVHKRVDIVCVYEVSSEPGNPTNGSARVREH
eukprot:111792-Amorphochlora_amoeboformis.AAC.1